MAAVTSRYARAFAEVVFAEKLDIAMVMDQLRALAQLVDASPELRRIWDNPAIAAAQKLGILDAIVRRENFLRPVRNFAAVLIDHRRVTQLTDITRHVETEVNQRLGFADAEVTSAREMAEPEKRALEAQIAKLAGKRVHARYATDGALLGGAIVRLGSTIYDGSVRGQLQRMKEQLAG